MTERERDPLFDSPGDPAGDTDLARIEALLAPLAHDAPLRALPPRRASRARRVAGVVAALAMAAVVGLVVWSHGGGDRGFRFEALEGRAQIASGGASSGVLPVGGVIETHAGDRVRVDVADIGSVVLGERSELALVETGPERHRFDLRRGRLTARVTARPRLFVIDTPSASAIDLGCAYDLEVGPDGEGVLRVTHGAVELVAGDRIAVVPMGAHARIMAGRGPGTPAMATASVELGAAIERFDDGDRSALDAIPSLATARDSVTPWNLLARRDLDRSARERLFDGIAREVPLPRSIDRQRIIAGDRAEIEQLRAQLEASWIAPASRERKDE